MDVVYIVRPGHVNEELRYSLRGLAHVPHGEVWIVGHRPEWVTGVRHIFVAQQNPLHFKYENGTANLIALAEHGPERFALFNDDFFCVEPVMGMPLPAHRGTLRALAADRPGRYGQMLLATAALLAEGGNPAPLAYTLHKPLIMSRDGLQLTLNHGLRARAGNEPLSWRSLYGNLMRLGGEYEPDVKVHAHGPIPDGAWLSTSDASFKYHRIGKLIRAALPVPSPYEVVTEKASRRLLSSP